MELSKERLEEIVSDPTINQGSEFAEMARRLLAAEEQQPVAWEVKGILCHSLDEANRYVGEPEPLYLHPQQGKAVQITDELYKIANHIAGAKGGLPDKWYEWAYGIETDIGRAAMLAPVSAPDFDEWSRKCDLQIALCDPEFREKARYIWDEACRAAMLSNEPVSNRDELNSPAIPDSWKLVPSEATAEMIWAAKYVMSSTVGWDSFKEAYRAMIAAAPQSVPEKSKSEKFDIALSRSMENNKDTLAALAKK